ncbi:hypothetical protein SPHV1_380003 [Novosphingobium sp. KN65.2]|nr:hypothetical protein SPHV1_380003 [Novosphingobium sp. KN65.2]
MCHGCAMPQRFGRFILNPCNCLDALPSLAPSEELSFRVKRWFKLMGYGYTSGMTVFREPARR